MTYRCRHFKITELVPPVIGALITPENEHRYWQIFDDRLLKTADAIRDLVDCPAFVNTWDMGESSQAAGGIYKTERGVRFPGMKHYRQLSQHSYGRALDMVFLNATGPDVQQTIIEQRELFPYITALELEVGHLHFEVRNWDKGLLTFSPTGSARNIA